MDVGKVTQIIGRYVLKGDPSCTQHPRQFCWVGAGEAHDDKRAVMGARGRAGECPVNRPSEGAWQ
ncbi:hypothetical protein AMTR_s00134p00047110 [Amborella trichopoda]|uniref:Uncharacterized protein n=1 Tax=Amborella trichopoda TaxID=13333 RepID=W1P4V7_AMBTC|nr:hypothetical protein AMTR_s00134p00047110 [Amborella trichopoda]